MSDLGPECAQADVADPAGHQSAVGKWRLGSLAAVSNRSKAAVADIAQCFVSADPTGSNALHASG
jgi:hypothetical protein